MLDELQTVKEQFNKINIDPDFSPETTILLSDPVKLDSEYRVFVVNRNVVDICLTHVDGHLRPSRIEDSLYTRISEFVNFSMRIYAPHHSFVIDVAFVDNEIKIVEYNCLNCSGFYMINAQKVFKALLENK